MNQQALDFTSTMMSKQNINLDVIGINLNVLGIYLDVLDINLDVLDMNQYALGFTRP